MIALYEESHEGCIGVHRHTVHRHCNAGWCRSGYTCECYGISSGFINAVRCRSLPGCGVDGNYPEIRGFINMTNLVPHEYRLLLKKTNYPGLYYNGEDCSRWDGKGHREP